MAGRSSRRRGSRRRAAPSLRGRLRIDMPSLPKIPSLPPAVAAALAWSAAGVAWAMAVIGLTGQAARWHEPLDMINQFAPLWAMPGLILAGLAGLHRGAVRWAAAAAGLILAVLFSLMIAPEISAHRSKAKGATGEVVTVVQFNIWKNNARASEAADWVIGQAPDVIVLTEGARSSWAAVQQIEKDYPFVVGCLSPRKPTCSTMIMSKVRPIAGEGLAHGDPENRRALSAAWARFEGKGGPFTVVAIHMPRPGLQQQSQQGELAAFVARVPDQDRLIVAGDFNAAPWSFGLKRMDKLLRLERRTRGLATWPALVGEEVGKPFPLPILPLDHLYAGPGWKTLSVERGPKLGSDHYPVTIDLAATE